MIRKRERFDNRAQPVRLEHAAQPMMHRLELFEAN